MLLVLGCLLSSLSPPLTALASGEQGSTPSYVFLFYVPYATPERIAEIASHYNLSAVVVNLEVDLNVSPDYYLYWLLSGVRPSTPEVLLYASGVNREQVDALWKNTTLVDVPLLDPSSGLLVLDPAFNLSAVYLPPGILEVPVNGSRYWEELGTTLSTKLVGETLDLRLEDLNVTLSTLNVSAIRVLGPRPVNISTPVEKAGVYPIAFYVVNRTNTTICLFFPGALNFANLTISEEEVVRLDYTISHWYLLLQGLSLVNELGNDTLEWWLKSTATTSRMYIAKAILNANTPLYIVYVPHVMIARRVTSGEKLAQFEEYLHESLITALSIYADIMKPNYLAMFVTVNETRGSLVFVGKNITEGKTVELTMTQLVGSMLLYSNALPLRHLEMLVQSSRVNELEKELSDLRSTVNDLNNTLVDTKSKLSECESTRELLQTKLMEVDSLRQNAEELMNKAKLYIATGLVVPAAISVVLGFLAFRVALRRKPAK